MRYGAILSAVVLISLHTDILWSNESTLVEEVRSGIDAMTEGLATEEEFACAIRGSVSNLNFKDDFFASTRDDYVLLDQSAKKLRITSLRRDTIDPNSSAMNNNPWLTRWTLDSEERFHQMGMPSYLAFRDDGKLEEKERKRLRAKRHYYPHVSPWSWAIMDEGSLSVHAALDECVALLFANQKPEDVMETGNIVSATFQIRGPTPMRVKMELERLGSKALRPSKVIYQLPKSVLSGDNSEVWTNYLVIKTEWKQWGKGEYVPVKIQRSFTFSLKGEPSIKESTYAIAWSKIPEELSLDQWDRFQWDRVHGAIFEKSTVKPDLANREKLKK